jgi:anti-sigma factor ChrR (cupin superfamily)
MSELFDKLSGISSLNLPTVGTLDVKAEEIEWQVCDEEGFYIKPLLEDDKAELRTWLMRIDAGAFSPMHAHDDIEQIFVIDGSFYDQDKTYGPGDYIIRAPDSMHSAGSEDGAVVLLFYSPVSPIE